MSGLARQIEAAGEEIDRAVECWAARVIARSILWIDGAMDLHTAVDGAWAAAERAGLVDEFGPDEIQAALGLAFGSVEC